MTEESKNEKSFSMDSETEALTEKVMEYVENQIIYDNPEFTELPWELEYVMRGIIRVLNDAIKKHVREHEALLHDPCPEDVS